MSGATPHGLQRRGFNALLGAAATGFWAGTTPALARAAVAQDDIAQELGAIERRAQGRLGVCIVDTASGTSLLHRADEAFLMCSTFKLMACARALQRVDQGHDRLDRTVPFGRQDLVPYSPVTEQQVATGGMTLGALCAATITTSDNTAANLIIDGYGGPPALTAWMRTLGDTVTRLDRHEPALNLWTAGDLRDTTSPRAIVASMQRVLLADGVLKPSSRQHLQAWLRANTTGDTRLRAGLPAGWAIGDKTGKSSPGNNNDLAIVWPPQGAPPLLVAVYLSESRADDALQDRCIADVGALLPQLVAAR